SVELHDKVIGHYLNIKHYQQVGVITVFCAILFGP
ncbi:IS1 family transposase, partial [Citrobacter freundii]